jgi:hypothetical protein
VRTAIMIPTTVPSAIVIVVTTDNHRTAFAVNSSKPGIMVAVPNPHIDILCERGDCNTQSHNRRNDTKTAPHCTLSLFPCRFQKPTFRHSTQHHAESSVEYSQKLASADAENLFKQPGPRHGTKMSTARCQLVGMSEKWAEWRNEQSGPVVAPKGR